MPETVHAGAGSRLIFKLLGGALSVLFALVAVPSAQAEEVFTGQAAAANATDSTWIAAPSQRVAVCIVDSGNDPNPDTANVVARFAVDGGSGGDVSDQKHGTLMSMIAAAPFDGFGMVGAAASINVVSVRAMSPNSADTFGLADIVQGVQTCQNYASTYNIKVISLSVGGPHSAPGGDTTAEALIRDTVDRARAHGLDVVAAAGNRGTSSVDWPAAYTPVVAVGAADNGGAPCSFASYGPEVDLWTSGCPVDAALPDGRAAWASGSSEATAFTAAVLAQLRGLRPDLSVDAAEALLTSTTSTKGAGRALDVAAAFHAAGLDAQLALGHSAIPNLAPPAATPSSPPSAQTAPQTPAGPAPVATTTPGLVTPRAVRALAARLSKPRVRSVRYRNGQLTFVFMNKPAGMQARVQVYTRKRGKAFPTLARNLRVTRDRLRTRVSGTLSQVSITYVDPNGQRGQSASLSLYPGT